MATRTDRLERITNLLLALLDTPRSLSLREIGASVAGYPTDPGALRQAFERDKRTLRDEGIPITTERIDGDDQVGYRILPEQYYLPDLRLDVDEQQALAFALATVRLDSGVSHDVGAKLGAPQSHDLPPIVVLPNLPALGVLQEAIRTRSIVQFTYRDRPRAIGGYGLAFKQGSWYFIGRPIELANDVTGAGTQVPTARGSDELRTFRVDRISDDPVIGQPDTYEVPGDFDIADALRFAPFATSNGAIEVVIDVDVRESRRALSLVGARSRIDGAPQGSMRLQFAIGDTEAFVGWILGLGDAVEVIAPGELRELIVQRLRDVVEKSDAQARIV